MREPINWDRVVKGASWVIVAILIYGVIFILTAHLNPTSPIVHAMGETTTRVVFVTMYAVQGGLLGYAKLFKKDTLRRHTLMFIYLTGFFLSILGFILNGVTIRLISNLLLSSLAAVCWLYWKFKTDYMSHAEAREFNGHFESNS